MGAGESKVEIDIHINYNVLSFMAHFLGSDCQPVALNVTSFVDQSY